MNQHNHNGDPGCDHDHGPSRSAPQAGPVAMEARGLWFSYGLQVVLRDVSFSVREGDFVAVIGPNGGGKTTLLKLLLGILTPDRGEVRLFGRAPADACDLFGYVPQDAATRRAFPISVLDVVLMGRLGERHGRAGYSREDRALAKSALERVGLAGHRRKNIERLSGGERQRVFIARAIVNRPRLLFLDEPLSSIDPGWQEEMFKLLEDLNRETTIVLVSHNISVISRCVKSVMCVNETVHTHDTPEITPRMLQDMYHCPVELIAHGVPHRVLPDHENGGQR